MAITGSVWAVADGNPATDQVPRVVPYDGVLEFDGAAVHGATSMRFALHAWDESLAGTVPSGTPLWSEEWSNLNSKSCAGADCRVPVRAGRFAVQLGRHANIMPTIQDADDVCLSIAVQNGSGWVALGGCQRFTPAPTALWSASGSNPHIAGNLTVDGQVGAQTVQASTLSGTTANLTGQLNADTARLSNGVRADSHGVYRGAQPASGDLGLYSSTNGAWVRYVSTNGHHKFYTDGSGMSGNGNPAVTITSAGRLDAPNTKTMGHCDCEHIGTNTSSQNSGAPNDTRRAQCPAGKSLVGFDQEWDCGSNDNCIYQIQCCRLCHLD